MKLFNSESNTRAFAQICNVVVLTYAVYSIFKSPEATLSEFALQVAVHATTIFALQKNTKDITTADLGIAALNFVNMGSVYARATSGCTSIPLLVNIVDGIGSLVSAATSIVTDGVKENPPQPVN